MSYRFVDSFQAGPSWSCLKAVYKPVWHIPFLSVQWINFWWWTEELSETCRVLWQNKLVHLVGFITKKPKLKQLRNLINLRFYRNVRLIKNKVHNWCVDSETTDASKTIREKLHTERQTGLTVVFAQNVSVRPNCAHRTTRSYSVLPGTVRHTAHYCRDGRGLWRSMSKLSIHFAEIFTPALGNLEEPNNILEPSILKLN